MEEGAGREGRQMEAATGAERSVGHPRESWCCSA